MTYINRMEKYKGENLITVIKHKKIYIFVVRKYFVELKYYDYHLSVQSLNCKIYL